MCPAPKPSVAILDHVSALADSRELACGVSAPGNSAVVLCVRLSGMEDFVEVKLGRAVDGVPAPVPTLRARPRRPMTRSVPSSTGDAARAGRLHRAFR